MKQRLNELKSSSQSYRRMGLEFLGLGVAFCLVGVAFGWHVGLFGVPFLAMAIDTAYHCVNRWEE